MPKDLALGREMVDQSLVLVRVLAGMAGMAAVQRPIHREKLTLHR